ncbi:pyocin knob domain-containing protein [Chryseobacterium sp. ON_d1]|uniref:pyocin knob domain-containing protein n=1 Tax=Chryseobacterium sp. ON_d1 TaxID=2583211 RepID=UPI001158AC15|nr:pyocin knob domain-containing protein [Chryseobacterium sp. ON_d1]GEJ44113.1 hypothetical protein CRS_07210 [Chryseobacterium sp. ON_d1]
MIAPEYFNNHIAIEGEIIVKSVPNDAGFVLVWNPTTKKISQRTKAEIIADLDIMTLSTNQFVYGHKSFMSSGVPDEHANNLWVRSDDGSEPGITFWKTGYISSALTLRNDGFHFGVGANNHYDYVKAEGFRKNGSSDNFFLTGGGNDYDSRKKEDSWFHSGRNFPQGTFIETDIDYSVTYGDQFLLEMKGNMYSNGQYLPLDAKIQGYIYNDTIISEGGYSTLNYFNYVICLNFNGKLAVWFPGMGYWQGFDAKITVGYGGLDQGRNRVTSITDSTDPGGTKRVQINLKHLLTKEELISGNTFWEKKDVGGYWALDSDKPIAGLNGSGAQVILSGGLLASPSYSDSQFIPAHGIHSRGFVQSDEGFQNRFYKVNERNRIWSFANADNYGISYFQGSGHVLGEGINFHFGDAGATGHQFFIQSNGRVFSEADGNSGDWKHKEYNINNYLGADYISGGQEKPNSAYFGAGKLKLQMLEAAQMGFSNMGWSDVLWMSSYTGSDVKKSTAIVSSKYNNRIGFVKQDYDSDKWGEAYDFWTTFNLPNPVAKADLDNYVTLNTQQTVDAKKTFNGATGNSYSESAIMVNGNGSGLYPAIGFHQPGNYAGTISLRNSNQFYFRNTDDSDFNYLLAKGYVKSGSDDSYILLGGGGHRSLSDFALSGQLGNYLPLGGGTLTGGGIISSNGDIVLKQNNAGGNATGVWWQNKDGSGNRIAGIGALTENGDFVYHYLGWDDSPWNPATALVVNDSLLQYKNNKVWHEGILEDYHNYGLGRLNIPVLSDLDTYSAYQTGIYSFNDNAQHRPYDYGTVIKAMRSTNEGTEIAANVWGTGLAFRGYVGGTYGPWREVWHSLNFNPDTKVNKSGDTMTGNLIVPNVVLSSNSLLSQTLNGSQIIAALNDTMYIGNTAGLDYLNLQSRYGLTHYQNGVPGNIWTSHNFNPDNYIPKTHPVYNITQNQINGWNHYLGYWDNRIIQPANALTEKLQFGFTSWNNDGNYPYADYLHFGGYQDGSGGNQNLITFNKNGFGLRQWQGSSQGVSRYQSFVDYWNTGDFAQQDINQWKALYNTWGTSNPDSFVKLSTGSSSIDISGTDLNDLQRTGFFKGSGLGHSPTGTTEWFFITCEHHYTGWASQTATTYGTGASDSQPNRVFKRAFIGGSYWTDWVEMTTSANNNQNKKKTYFWQSPAYTGTMVNRVYLPEWTVGDVTVRVNSSYHDGYAIGVIEMQFTYGINTGGVWGFEPKITQVFGNIRQWIYVEPKIFYDSAESRPYINVHKFNPASNPIYIDVTLRSFSNNLTDNSVFFREDASTPVLDLRNNTTLDDSLDLKANKNGNNATNTWIDSSNGLQSNPTIIGKMANSGGQSDLANATYGQVAGYINTNGKAQGCPTDDWWYRFKMLHANSAGYYGEMAVQMTGGNSFRYKRVEAGGDYGWIQVWDKENLTPSHIALWDLAYNFTLADVLNFNDTNGDWTRFYRQDGSAFDRLRMGMGIIDSRVQGNGLGGNGSPDLPNSGISALNHKVLPLFHSTKQLGWSSSLIFKGWTDSYKAWKIMGPADNNNTEQDFYLSQTRSDNGQWMTERKIWTSKDFSQSNVNTWNNLTNAVILNQQFTNYTGNGLIIVDDYQGGESGIYNENDKLYLAALKDEYYKYSSGYDDWEGINFNRKDHRIGIGRPSNDTDKLTVEGSVKASGNFKSEKEDPNTLFIADGSLAFLNDEITHEDDRIRLSHGMIDQQPGVQSYDSENRMLVIRCTDPSEPFILKECFRGQRILILNTHYEKPQLFIIEKTGYKYDIPPYTSVQLFAWDEKTVYKYAENKMY